MSAVRVAKRPAAVLLALFALAQGAAPSLGAQAPVTPAPNPLAVPSRTPAIRVTLSAEELLPGDRVRVLVRPRRDAYLVVLHADPAGRVRVLFPLDPGDAQRMAGGSQSALPSRDGGASFVAGSATGDGAVLAAISATPFRVAPLASGGHWNVRAFPRLSPGADPEGELVAVVRRMTAGGARFDYAVAPYRVVEERPVVVYERDGYAGSEYATETAPIAATSAYDDDYWFSYGFPFYAGGLFARGFPGFFSPCAIGRGRFGTGLRTGCFASGRISRRSHPFPARFHDRRGRRPDELAFPGNPSFGEVRAFGTPTTGPRAVAGGRRTVPFPASTTGGGIIYRSPPPSRPAPAPTAAPPAAPPAPSGGGMIGVPARPRGGPPPRQPSLEAPRRPSSPRMP